MVRLCDFLESPPPEIIRIKDFVTANKNQFLVQADKGNFAIGESTATSSKQALPVIDTPAINSKAVMSTTSKIANL